MKEKICCSVSLWIIFLVSSHLSAVPLTELSGKVNAEKHPGFVLVNARYTGGKKIYLRKEVYQNFQKMAEAAEKEGIFLRILSGFRSFNDQKSIWEAKWNGKRQSGGINFQKSYSDAQDRASAILRYSSMPGTSRHHWGTDMDLNSLENRYFEEGPGLKIYQWLSVHASQFGFCQPYTAKGQERPWGYEEEKWHWSFRPTASLMLKSLSLLEAEKQVRGFKGWETFMTLKVFQQYILGIHPQCR